MQKPAELDSIPYLDIYPTGSRYTCTPPVTDTDQDWVLLPTSATYAALDSEGFVLRGYKDKYGTASDYCKGDINIILVENRDKFNKWVLATEAARKLNLQTRAERCALFRVILREEFNRWPSTFEEIFD